MSKNPWKALLLLLCCQHKQMIIQASDGCKTGTLMLPNASVIKPVAAALGLSSSHLPQTWCKRSRFLIVDFSIDDPTHSRPSSEAIPWLCTQVDRSKHPVPAQSMMSAHLQQWPTGAAVLLEWSFHVDMTIRTCKSSEVVSTFKAGLTSTSALPQLL